MHATVQGFHDPATATITYVVSDVPGGNAAIIDPVLDFDHKSGRTRTHSMERVAAYVRETRLQVQWILETHAHADHLSGSQYLQRELGGRIAIGNRIGTVQAVFRDIYNLGADFLIDGSQFDHLFADDERFAIGGLEGHVMFVPGHTPADAAYVVGDAVFVGDTMFMPDVGTARCDFPGGNAHTLFASIKRLLALPPSTRIFVCHDYPPAGRQVQWETTVQAQRSHNIHVNDQVSEEDFVAMRTARDRTLDMPLLILPSIQVNIRAGRLPPPESNGTSYLKLPLDLL